MIDPAALRDLFDRAASLAAADRAPFLVAACAGNEPLRKEVERLLAADARLGSALDSQDPLGSSFGRVAEPSRTLGSGTALGPYVIDALIGVGGMGEVYRAHDTRLGRTVAIKVLPAALTQDDTARQRFEREARATAALNHPNIVALHDVGEASGVSYVVTELLQGDTLRDRLRSGPLPARKALEIASSVLDGLAAAHGRGIAHRDLKPENIFITSDDQVKILDFGLAKLVSGEPHLAGSAFGPSTHTTPGAILGTIGYMAPEQVRGLATDALADIFSFGAILYEMLSGARAFTGATPADVLSAILNADPPDATLTEKGVAPSITVVIRRCLEKDPRHRFQSARDVGFALETASAASPLNVAVEKGPSRSTRRPRVRLMAMGAAGVLTGAVAAWGLLRAGDTAPPTLAVSVAVPPGLTLDGPPAVAPDRHAIAFTALDANGMSRVWIRRFDRIDAAPLEGTEGATQPFWSADGRSIGFFARGHLWRTELFGGAPQVLADVTSPRGGAWSIDDTIVFAPHPDAGLYKIAAGGGAPVPITTRDASSQELSHRWPRVLPDGRHLLFLNRIAPELPLRHVIVLATIDGAPQKRLVDADSTGVFAEGRLLFERGGTLFAQELDLTSGVLSGQAETLAEHVWWGDMAGLVGFDAVDGAIAWRPALDGPTQMTWFDRAGRPVGTIGPPSPAALALSPDGRVLLYIKRDEQQLVTGGLWSLDLTRGTAARVTAPYETPSSPVWSPDGRRICYAPIRSGAFDVWIRDLDGQGPERPLVESSRMKAPVSWSPDGRRILFNAADPKTDVDLWSVEVDAPHSTPMPVAGGAGVQCCGRFSPDGKWIAYVSNETGRYEVVVRPFERSGATVRISIDGGFLPEWRSDGHELFFIGLDNRLMAAPVAIMNDVLASQPPIPLFRIRTNRVLPDTLTDDRIYAPDGLGDRFIVIQQTGEPVPPVLNVIFDRHAR
jgi:Tol biopolymer transport system component